MEDENIPEGFELVEDTSVENIPDGFEVVDDVEISEELEPAEDPTEMLKLEEELDGWQPDVSFTVHNPNYYEELPMMDIERGKYQKWKRLQELREPLTQPFDPNRPPSPTFSSISKPTLPSPQEMTNLNPLNKLNLTPEMIGEQDEAVEDIDEFGIPIPQPQQMDLGPAGTMYNLPVPETPEQAAQRKYSQDELEKGKQSQKDYYAKENYGKNFKQLTDGEKAKVNKRIENEIFLGDREAWEDGSRSHYNFNVWDKDFVANDGWVNAQDWSNKGIVIPYNKANLMPNGRVEYSIPRINVGNPYELQNVWVQHESNLYKNKDLRYLTYKEQQKNPNLSKTEAEDKAEEIINNRREEFTRRYFNDEMLALEDAKNNYLSVVEKYGDDSEEAAKAASTYVAAHKKFTEAEMLFDPSTGEFKNKSKFTKAKQGELADYNESVDQRAQQLAETTDQEDLEDLSNTLMYDLYALNTAFATSNVRNQVWDGVGLYGMAADEIRNENGIAFLQGKSIYNYGIDYLTGTKLGTSMKFKNPLAKYIDNDDFETDVEKAMAMRDVKLGDNRMPFKLSHIPGNSAFAQQYNAKLDEFLSVSKAIQLNYDPTTLERTGGTIFQPMKMINRALTNIGPTMLGESSTYRSESADQLAKDFVSALEQGGYEMSDEVKERVEDTTNDLIMDTTPQLANFLLEMFLLKGVGRAAGAGRLYKSAVGLGKGTNIYKNSRIFKHAYDISAATIREIGIGIGINKMDETLTGNEGMSLTGWGAVGAGNEISNKMMSALFNGKIPGFGNIMYALGKSKIAQGFAQGTMQATASTGVMAGSEMFDQMVNHDKSFGEAWEEYFPKNEEGNYDFNSLQKAMITFSHMTMLGVGSRLTNNPPGLRRTYKALEADLLAIQGKNPVTKASAKELGLNYDKAITEKQINDSYNKRYNEVVTDPKFDGQFTLNPINGKIVPKKGSLLETEIRNLTSAKNNMLQFKDLTAIQNDIMSRQKAQKGNIKGTVAGKAEIFTKEKQAAELGQTINADLNNTGNYKVKNLEEAELITSLPVDMIEFGVAGANSNPALRTKLKQIQARQKNNLEYINQYAPGKNNPLRKPIYEKLQALETEKSDLSKLQAYKQSPEGKTDPTIETKILRTEEKIDQLNKELDVDLKKGIEQTTLKREADIAKARERVGSEAIEEYSQNEYIEKAKEAGVDVGKGQQEGFFIGKDKAGKERILINKDWAKEVGNVSVGTHEVLHKLTKDALPEGTAETNRLISEFKKSLTYDQYNTIKDAVESTSAFKKNPNTVEWINVFQDAVRKGDISPNSKGWKGIGDVYEKVFRKGGFEKIEFKTGKDVYDYVVDYAVKDKAPELKAQELKSEDVKTREAAREEGQFSGKQELEAERKTLMDEQLKLGKEAAGSKLYEQNKARIQEISRELKGDAVKLKELSQKDRDSFITNQGKQLNKLWTKDLKNLNKMDKIIDKMIENHAYKRGLDKLPDFKMDEFIAETRRGVSNKGTLRGLDKFIWGQNKFDAAKNDNFYGYLNRFLKVSADNALKSGNVTSKDFKGELSGKESTPSPEPIEPTIVKSKAREIVGIKTPQELTKLIEEGKLSKGEYDQQLKRYNEIENKVVDYLQKEVLKDEVVTEKLGKDLNDYLRKELAADIRGEMGKGKAYEDFIVKAYDEVLKPLSEQPGPVNDIFTRAKQRDLWYEGTGKRYVKIKGKSQPELMRKLTPSKERVKDYYLKQGDFAKAPNSKGNLKIALSEQLSEIIGKDIMPSLLNSGKAFKGLSPENKALLNKDVTTGIISDMIKRNPDMQFSETVKRKIPDFGQNTFDSFRLMKTDHPRLFKEFRAAVIDGVEQQWLEANPNFNKYLEQPILRAAKRKALAARKESQSFKKAIQKYPDKVMWNGKELDISSLKNADWDPMSGTYKGGKYYDTNIIKPYLEHAGKFAEYLPKWLLKMANKEAVLQTLGSSTQATGRSVSTITESLDYQSGRSDYNPNKPVKYKYDLLTGKEIGADPIIKNQAETLMKALGKNESKVFKALEKEIAELATPEGQKPKKFSEMTDKEIAGALSKAGFASDAAMKNVMKKDFSKMTDAERADVLATRINARNNAIRQKVYDAIQQAKEQYIKDAPNQAEALKRMEYILRLQKNNTMHTSAFDRQAVPVEAIFMPEGSKLSDKTVKLEHIKTSVEQSMQVGKAIIEGKWGERGKKIMSDYTGVLAPKELLDIIDDKGGNTNAAKRARMVLDLQRLKNYKVVGPDGKFTESYYDKVINDLASELKLTKGDKAMLKADWIADQVVENIQNPSKANEIKLKQRLDNAKTYEKQFKENTEIQPSFSQTKKFKSQSEQLSNLSSVDRALQLARKQKTRKDIKKARVFDFDDTVARTNSKVFATKGNERKILTAEEFAKQGEQLVNEGWKMDFSDFNKVVEGKKGPLFEVMKKMKEAAGERDLFILTARAPESAKAIHTFLKEMGIDIPLENITGLGNSTANAKANWIVDKAAEAYNDFYFADDHMANVKAVKDVLNVLDVKGKVQQAKFSETLSKDFNKLLEESTGVEWYKEFSAAKAEVMGANKGKRKIILPSSAEDFLGLVYTTLGKGKVGERQLQWYQDNVFKPYNRAMHSLSTDRVNMMADFKALKKQLNVPKDLRKKTKSGFTNEQAVRTYLWGRAGEKIPGLSKADLAEMNKIIENDPKLKAFAEQIELLTKGDGYVKPDKNWLAGTITTDLIKLLNTTKRGKYLEEWQANVDQIYSKENLNKLEALYGKKYREALENSLSRMKSGKNRTSTGNRLSNQVLDYINQSQGVIMFFNMRSALLQTISATNFINMSFNNPIKAGRAFANQKQYWKDFLELMNSDYLVDRRNGLKLNISESEIADAAATSKNKAKAAINYLIEKGYAPTRIADSFAIASGGATWYRNRIKELVKKEGLTEIEAKRKAFEEFRETAEISQQSSDPSKISQQQSSDIGRMILQFVNTPMQYTRIQKRALQDIINKRGDWKSNAGKIMYYGIMQNLWFNAMQQGLFAVGFGDDELNDKEQKKVYDTANGMVDSILRGTGLGGITLSVLKNTVLDIYDRSQRKRPEYGDAWQNLLQFSPAIRSKFSKLKQAAWPFDSKKRRQEIFDKGFSLDNPAWESAAKVISATTNIPLDRLFTKYENLESMASDDTETWEKVFNFLGWPEWSLDVTPTDPKKSKYKKPKNTSTKKKRKRI